MSIPGSNHVRSSFFNVFTLSLLTAVFTCTLAKADPAVQITQCGTVISQPGHYILANDLSCNAAPVSGVIGTANSTQWFQQFQVSAQAAHPTGTAPTQDQPPISGDGIDIISDHVELELNGHTIDGGGSGNIGIAVGVGVPSGNAFVHIDGPGTITNFGSGIDFEQVSHSSVVGVTVTNTLDGILVLGGLTVGCGAACPSTKNDLHGNSVAGSFVGFGLQAATDNSLRDNNVTNTGFGIALADSTTGNDVRANTTNNNFAVGIIVGFFGTNATNNDITHNTALDNGSVDLVDANPNCDSNTWQHNTFGTANQPCIQ